MNLLFVKADGSLTRTLFRESCLIVMQTYAGRVPIMNQSFGTGPKFLNKNIHLVVTADTNNQGTFDINDRKDLFVSDYDGSNMKEVLQSVSSYQAIDEDKILILQDSQGATQYYSYDVVDGSLKQLINTKDLGYSNEGSK